jgi:hypothetical protein
MPVEIADEADCGWAGELDWTEGGAGPMTPSAVAISSDLPSLPGPNSLLKNSPG